MGPALGEGRAVSTALTSLAQQPDASSDNHTNLVRRSGDDRVHGHLLLRGLDDSHLRQPVLEPRHRPCHREVSHARSVGSPIVAQVINFLILVWLLKRFLYKPILNAIDEREKGIATVLAEAEAKKAASAKGTRRLSAQERGLRPGSRLALEKSHRGCKRRTSAVARGST